MRLAFRCALNRRSSYRRIISAALLIAFAATAAGVPLPTGGARLNDSDETFICATSSCGCKSAEQCWRSCCCHSLTERLAWAKENGIRPPDFIIANARSAGHDLSWLDRRSGTFVNIIGQSQRCCEKKVAQAARSCCDRPHIDAPANDVRTCCSMKQDAHPARTVIAWQALKCGGHSMSWLAAVPTVVTVHADFAFELAPPAWLQPPTSDHAQGSADLPAVPPPERA